MTFSRSLLGRTSFLWAAGFVVLAALCGLVNLSTGPGLPLEAGSDTYYLVAHFHYLLSVEATFLVLGGVYLALEQLRRGRHRRLLGGLHFGVMFVGVLTIFAPALLLGLAQPPQRYADPVGAFRMWNEISAAGYDLSLAAQAFFLGALIDALRPSPQIG